MKRRTLTKRDVTPLPPSPAMPKPLSMEEITGTALPSEQAKRVVEMLYAPVISITALWDGRAGQVTALAISAQVTPAQIINMLSDAQKFAAASMAQEQPKPKAPTPPPAPAPMPEFPSSPIKGDA